MRDIFVAEDFDLGPGEACTVDDGGVVEFVGQDEIFFAQDRADGAGVGGEAGLEDNAGFNIFEGGDFFFELHMNAHGAGDGADCAGSHAVFTDGADGGFFELGVIAKAEVVVAREVDDLAAVVGADGALYVVQLTQFEEGASTLEVIELSGEVGELRTCYNGRHNSIVNLFAGARCLVDTLWHPIKKVSEKSNSRSRDLQSLSAWATNPSRKRTVSMFAATRSTIGRTVQMTAFAFALTFAGCKSSQDKANDNAIAQAKQQAAATGSPQQVVWTDKDGNTVTTLIQPPAPGQTMEQVTTTRTTNSTSGGQTTHATTSTTEMSAIPGPTRQQNLVQNGPVSGPANGPGQTAVGPNQQGYSNGPGGSGNATAPGAAGYGAGTQQPVSSGPVISPVDVNVPRGTDLAIRINQHISVKTSRAGERFSGEVVRDVMGEGSNRIAIPHGTPVEGVIDASHKRGHFKGSSILELRLTSMELNGQRYALDTRDNVRTKKGKGKRSAAFIGGGTGLGMLVGGVASGGVGLLVGGLAGAGAGTALGGLTGNRDIEIPAESVVNFRLAEDLSVRPQ